MMGQETPQTQALTRALLEPGDTSAIERFKADPHPLLSEHGVELSDEEHDRLHKHLDAHDAGDLHEQLLGGGLHTMW